MIFTKVRHARLRKSQRKRQCWHCHSFIEKDELYVDHVFCYDKRDMAIAFHRVCYSQVSAEASPVKQEEMEIAAIL
jgi:hypothetical protein